MKKFVSFAFVLCFIVSMCSSLAGAVEPRASLYLNDYYVDATAIGNGKILIEFDIDATDTMDFVGASRILVQKKNSSGGWDDMKYYYVDANPSMMDYEVDAHEGSVTYKGTVGKTYRAQIIITAGDSTGDDSRILYTVEATAY